VARDPAAPLAKGAAMVLGPEEGESFWQPAPHRGYMTVKVGPGNHAGGGFSMGIQVMPEGCHVRSHGHAVNDEILFVYEGRGRCVVDGVEHALEPGSTVLVGPYVGHSIHNDGPGDLKFAWFFTPPGLEQVVAFAGRPRRPGEAPPAEFQRPADMAPVLERAGYATPEEIARAKKA
jgi:mannose-6-phosphate isomerase-like protein (cupin superfamily)